MLEQFKEFLDDEHGWDMYITGRAGTGKTTGLAKLIEHCQQYDLDYTVCAFTHKACGILRNSLPQNAKVRTLHSFLKKRPTINAEATNMKHVEQSRKHGATDKAAILFVDEYSMVGEKDLMDIREAQDEETKLKVVWLGDPHQLPPVGDAQSVKPYGKYQVTLTKVYRQAASNPLMAPLNELVSFIEGNPATALTESESLIRKQDIVEWYDNDRMASDFDGIMLAYTNKRVQELNALAQGHDIPLPEPGDRIFNVSNRSYYTYRGPIPKAFVTQIERPFGEPMGLKTKFKTLEYLLDQGSYDWVEMVDEETEEVYTFCSVFGHYDYKVVKDSLTRQAAAANKAITDEYPDVKPAQWAKQNYEHPLAKARARAWREFLAFNECVVCLDFAHAMTVHKSQGSTYKTVYLDTEDLALAADIDYLQYLKLMYVAFSRASKYVVTN